MGSQFLPLINKVILFLVQNLLVTSTLTVSTDPYSRPVSPKPSEPDRVIEESRAHSAPIPNGVQTVAGDADEEMVEAEADEDAPGVDAEIDAQVADTEVHDAQVADTEVHDTQVVDTETQDVQNVDTEMQEEKVSEAPEINPGPSSDSGPATEPCTPSEQISPTPPEP